MVECSGMVGVDGAELYYEAAGEGQPLVLLHDGLLDRRVWDGQFEVFARRYKVVRYDRRGYGLSSVPDRPFSDLDDLHGLLGFLGLKRTYLLGMSNGGKVALEFALDHPDIVGALVLVGPNLGGYRSSEEKLRRIFAIFSVARERGVEAGVEAWMADPFYLPTIERVVERERVRRIMTENLRQLLSTPNFKREPIPPAIERLARIVAPAIILAGERDDPDNLNIASILESKLPHASKKLIADSGHLVNLEKPGKFYRVVTDYLG